MGPTKVDHRYVFYIPKCSFICFIDNETFKKIKLHLLSPEIPEICKVSRLDPQQVTSSAQPFPVSLSLFAPIFPKYLSPLCTLNTYTPQRLCAKYNQQFYAQSEDYCARSYCLREQSETDIRLDPYGVDLPYMVNTTVKSTEAKELKENTVYNLWSQQKGLPLIYAERGHLAYVTINLRLDKAGSSEKRFSAFSEAQGRPTANRARIWNHDLTYSTSSKQKNPVETSKPPQPAGGPHSKSRAHPARPAVREALVNRLPPIKSGQFCNKNNNQIIIYTSCNDKTCSGPNKISHWY